MCKRTRDITKLPPTQSLLNVLFVIKRKLCVLEKQNDHTPEDLQHYQVGGPAALSAVGWLAWGQTIWSWLPS